MPTAAALVELAEKNEPEAALVALTMLSTLLKNATADRAKFGSIKSSSKALASKVLQCEGGAEALAALSFRLQEDAYVFGAGEEPAEDAAKILAVFEGARTALLQLGDRNVPDVAMAALKLVSKALQNVVDAPEDAGKRRINAASKALQSKVLSAQGGRELLAAVGFEEQGSGDEAAFVCAGDDVRMLRVSLAVLNRASDVWSAEAAYAGPGLEPCWPSRVLAAPDLLLTRPGLVSGQPGARHQPRRGGAAERAGRGHAGRARGRLQDPRAAACERPGRPPGHAKPAARARAR